MLIRYMYENSQVITTVAEVVRNEDGSVTLHHDSVGDCQCEIPAGPNADQAWKQAVYQHKYGLLRAHDHEMP